MKCNWVAISFLYVFATYQFYSIHWNIIRYVVNLVILIMPPSRRLSDRLAVDWLPAGKLWSLKCVFPVMQTGNVERTWNKHVSNVFSWRQTVSVFGLCCTYRFHYCSMSSWWRFADKLVSSMQTAGNLLSKRSQGVFQCSTLNLCATSFS